MTRNERGGAVWFTSERFAAEPCPPRHGFSTRLGGVSTVPYLAGFNFGFREEEPWDVTRANYTRFAELLSIDGKTVVTARQTHTNLVKTVTRGDCGLGLEQAFTDCLADGRLEQRYADGFDGLVTAEPGVALSVRAADCVPILFWDPRANIIGACHAGWRGTLHGIAAETIRAMQDLGGNAEDTLVCIGASIGVCCYEVDELFCRSFADTLPGDVVDAVFCRRTLSGGSELKYHCDLRECNRLLLLHAGVGEGNIEVSRDCTCCQPERFHSHRASMKLPGGLQGKRGLMAAMISL